MVSVYAAQKWFKGITIASNMGATKKKHFDATLSIHQTLWQKNLSLCDKSGHSTAGQQPLVTFTIQLAEQIKARKSCWHYDAHLLIKIHP